MSDACGPNIFSCWESAMATVMVGSATSATPCAIGLMSSIGIAAGLGGAGVMSGVAALGASWAMVQLRFWQHWVPFRALSAPSPAGRRPRLRGLLNYHREAA